MNTVSYQWATPIKLPPKKKKVTRWPTRTFRPKLDSEAEIHWFVDRCLKGMVGANGLLLKVVTVQLKLSKPVANPKIPGT